MWALNVGREAWDVGRWTWFVNAGATLALLAGVKKMPSFPRRRESSALFGAAVDSRLRGNDAFKSWRSWRVRLKASGRVG